MDYYEVGQIINTHGIRGEVKAATITDFAAERFQKGKKLYLQTTSAQPLMVELQNVRQQKQFYLLSFVGYDDINQVEKFKGCKLLVTEQQQQRLSDDNFYYHQIVGLQVQDRQKGSLGTVKEILSLGANDVWVVARPPKKDLLLPAIKDVIKKVDLENGVVEIELLDGLDE
ncbi:ribosome maturation factor RimM [Liquorilactobacillus satsumensis]|uniref:Ribosome maturation factor RimM n=1 Tax=Liquorilactobacillus satsumensis DSM 16230 = JCM 12392 TaxID=1423801 RepID=A0A0R1V2Q9_9LACO|nr:ribosome maturation factor RimM [Liquorilactobacillus satsumensis]KRL99903.1 16S rRNA processing protein [Liquorilactobacillus satsumensis DSM 16230 = JCM 12392]MCC7665606.1 ribosome maturation factor RimM [Liquorilactobacillus satsumensis]MCP9311818.1 ribosome maturation factor RimM [Liquorilactobacillus satsumensis]MCP9328382.1 ribosome maturation factor RimM [Liquorilactobacillus satsumensis]MCP9357991.1 ribosome maturation factor RimM [Liquorilactobacillus satsumensis]